MRTLALTSPFTVSPAVTRAQIMLKRGAIRELRADYLRGPVDGIFGESTARACIRAKFWLGYSTASMLPVYGDQLHGYLKGTKPLGPVMKIRRARRLREAQEIPLRVKALNLARTKLGTKERPGGGANDSWVNDWYGIRGAWCAMFVTWAYVQAGSKSFKAGLTGVGGLHPGSGTYAYCPYVVGDARAGRNHLQIVSFVQAQPGDLVLFNWDGDWDADHIGLLEKKDGFGAFYSIEGNTAVGNDSNGGEVMRRYRKISQVQAFVRVGA